MPGVAVGAGGAVTVGENVFGPEGMRGAFWVGFSEGEVVCGVEVGVEVGAVFSLAHAATPTIATIAVAPAITATPRATRLMIAVPALELAEP